jgi:hypothetical protein
MLKSIFFNKDKEEKKDMKKNNMKFLKDFEADLITALFYDYTRQLPTSSLMEIDRIFTEETGKNLKTNFSCSACILKLLRLTAVLYFKDNLDSLPDDLKEKFTEKYNK